MRAPVCCAALTLVLAAPTPARATAITLTESFSVEAEEYYQFYPYPDGFWNCSIAGITKLVSPCQQVLMFDLFDSSLGTLDAVELSIDATFDWQLFADSPADISGVVWDPLGIRNYPLGAGHSSNGSDLDPLVNTISVPAGDLYKFLGPGTFGLVAEVVGGSGVADNTFYYYGLLEGEYSVTYTYTPPPPSVPEPATLLLLGTGLGAIAVRRRLKKRK